MKTWSRNVKIGIAFLVSLVMIYFGVNFLKGVNIFQKQNTYISVFDNVNNLNVSSPVLVNGYQVGLVNSIHMIESDSMELAVEIRLDKGFKVKKGSKLEFNTDFLGGSSVNLLINPYGTEILSPGDTIAGTRARGKPPPTTTSDKKDAKPRPPSSGEDLIIVPIDQAITCVGRL